MSVDTAHRVPSRSSPCNHQVRHDRTQTLPRSSGLATCRLPRDKPSTQAPSCSDRPMRSPRVAAIWRMSLTFHHMSSSGGSLCATLQSYLTPLSVFLEGQSLLIVSWREILSACHAAPAASKCCHVGVLTSLAVGLRRRSWGGVDGSAGDSVCFSNV